ncbi:MAG: hypothetical protein BWX77_01497 [Bacteroidetes bacterium ADurb.Bin090]|nr:MAG: hypothetical protein BWX77_01497 [Bacteroidetes bacterium ADurb.Bin090]
MIKCPLVATVHTDVVTLRDASLIHFLRPIRLIMIGIVDGIGRIFDQKIQKFGCFQHTRIDGLQQLAGINPVLIGVHHRNISGFGNHAGHNAKVNFSNSTLTPLGFYTNDSVGSLAPVERRTVFQYRDALNVVHINIHQNIGLKAFKNGLNIGNIVPYYTVNNQQRMCLGIQRIQTTDKKQASYAGQTGTTDGTYVSSQ